MERKNRTAEKNSNKEVLIKLDGDGGDILPRPDGRFKSGSLIRPWFLAVFSAGFTSERISTIKKNGKEMV